MRLSASWQGNPDGHVVSHGNLGLYLGGATRVVVQPWRCLTHFVRFHICRSEPKNALFVLEYYFDSDEMRRLQRRRFLRVVPFSFKLRF
ncbi:hypothetical protein HanXRQr2_Chr03g0093761 [Helianthus annuus]|uniref:Uncharacterized protein n=1 Tax=Helianthus annuus TaxID=4232 RepID=A0A9K3JCI2_HELAN|nr:hypothetical protein HanXRQr2_Chr03g0093761 [Helianthus annuus]